MMADRVFYSAGAIDLVLSDLQEVVHDVLAHAEAETRCELSPHVLSSLC
jgi:hypothetical protein